MARSVQELLAEAKSQIKEIDTDEVEKKLMQDPRVKLIDVREKDEQEQGVIPSALLISKGLLEMKIESAVPKKDSEIILYCAAGNRSALSALSLQQIGYQNVSSMIGGYSKWKQEGRKTEVEKFLTKDQLERYNRHILMPEVGEKGQIKLTESKVLCIGAGGLGCPTALYLVAAGVGTVGIIDDDLVDKSNLQRQILHNEERVGTPKVESAKKTLKALNSDVNIVTYQERLNSENVKEIIKGYDIVVNGCDNFPTRYLINDACVFAGIPLVDGSIFRFEGQVSVFDAKHGPCYRCLYPEPPPPEMAPSCQEAGVFGVLPGIIGSVQAVEVLKLLLGVGQPLVGRLLLADTLTMKIRTVNLKKDPACPVCSEHPTITDLIDYEGFCSLS